MNKKLLALLFAVPGFSLAQTAFEKYKVLSQYAPNLEQVAVDSKDVTGHDVALTITRNRGWYADAKDALVGVGQIILANSVLSKRIKQTSTSCIA